MPSVFICTCISDPGRLPQASVKFLEFYRASLRGCSLGIVSNSHQCVHLLESRSQLPNRLVVNIRNGESERDDQLSSSTDVRDAHLNHLSSFSVSAPSPVKASSSSPAGEKNAPGIVKTPHRSANTLPISSLPRRFRFRPKEDEAVLYSSGTAT